MKTLPPILPAHLPFSNFVQSPSPITATSNSHPHCSFCCHVSSAILLNDKMDLHVMYYMMIYTYHGLYIMWSLGNLVPEWPWCVFYATRCQVYWGLTHNLVFYWYSDLILHKHKHTNTHTYTHTHTHTQRACSGASRLTHPYKHIFTPSVLFSQQLTLLH